MRLQGGSSVNLAGDSWGALGRTFKGLRSWVGELSGWYRTSCDEHCGHHCGHHTARLVDNLLDCCCPRLGARPEGDRILQVLTSTHLRELKDVEQSTELQVPQEQGLSRTASVSRREYQGLLRTIGSTGARKGSIQIWWRNQFGGAITKGARIGS